MLSYSRRAVVIIFSSYFLCFVSNIFIIARHTETNSSTCIKHHLSLNVIGSYIYQCRHTPTCHLGPLIISPNQSSSTFLIFLALFFLFMVSACFISLSERFSLAFSSLTIRLFSFSCFFSSFFCCFSSSTASQSLLVKTKERYTSFLCFNWSLW